MNTYLIQKLQSKENLTQHEAEQLVNAMVTRQVDTYDITRILEAFHTKGETVDEIVGCIQAMRSHMLPVSDSSYAIDVCGTGGDRKGLFNVSTAVAFVVAAAGISVAKHGNRAASSTLGSADVIEALGINIQLTPLQAEHILRTVGMVFLFAPIFHPAFKEVGTVRKQLGIPTIFNYIGPFANPARVKRQLIGVPTIAIAEKLAQVTTKLDYEKVFIVTSEDGLDEISISAKTTLFAITNKTIEKKEIDPRVYGFTPIDQQVLVGKNVVTSAQIIQEILQGKKGPHRDMVVLNAAYAIVVSGKSHAITEAIALAEKAIDTGKAQEILQTLRKETHQYA